MGASMVRPRVAKPVGTELGDSHNFGRRVTLRGGRVVKPRSFLWEWLVLSAENPLRRLLPQSADRYLLVPGGLWLLPTLSFFQARSGGGGEEEQGEILPPQSRSCASKQ